MRIFGWTLDQAAAAKAYHKTCTGLDLQPTCSGMAQVQRFWRSKRRDDPCETKFEGIEPTKDFDWVIEVIKAT
jgi:hypothetical protein